MKIDKCYNGRAQVKDGNTQFFAWTIHVDIFDQVGLIQVNNGEKFLEPVELKAPGQEKTYSIGDYEITIKRVKQKPLSNDGVIDLKQARHFRAKAE